MTKVPKIEEFEKSKINKLFHLMWNTVMQLNTGMIFVGFLFYVECFVDLMWIDS